MTLRLKIPLIFLMVILGIVSINQVVLTKVVRQSFIDLELKEAHVSAEQLSEALVQKFESIDKSAGDWSKWDDAYAFVQGENPSFIETNMQNPAFEELDVNVMVFLDAAGQNVYRKQFDLVNKVEEEPSAWWGEYNWYSVGLLDQTTEKILGIVMIDQAPYVIAARPILTSSGEGPPAGMLVFGRQVDTVFMQKLSELVKFPVDYRLYSEERLPDDYRMAKQAFVQGNKTVVYPESEAVNQAYVLVKDIDDQPVLILRETLGREVYAYGKGSTYVFALLISGIAVGAAVLLIILLQTQILWRLARLTRDVVRIGPSGSLSGRVGEYGKDELGQLADSFNQTIESLEHVTEAKLYQERQSQSMLNVMVEAVIVTDINQRISYSNPACWKLFGYSDGEIHGKRLAEIFSYFDTNGKTLPARYLDDINSETGKRQKAKLYIQGKSKRIAAVVTSAPIVVNNQEKGIVRVFHDYTAELELQHQKDDFFSIASHELKTPLTVISGNIDNILQGYGNSSISEVDKKSLQNALDYADRLITIVNDYLSVSRLDQSRMVFDLKVVHICELIEKVKQELAQMLGVRGLSFTSECREPHNLVKADEAKLREILINLIGNSIKFTKQGGITLSNRVENNTLVIEVTDTGIGIDPEKQHVLFNRFQQAMDQVLSREAGGTGLGLYISKQLATMMGGDLWLVKSEPGKGSTFAFSLPLIKS